MNRAFISIIIGATLWGTISFYVKNLYDFGFTPMEVVTLRAWTSAILCIFIVLFYLINQLVTFAAKRGLHYFLSYFFGSFLFLVLFMTYLMLTNQTERMTEFFPLLLQLIGLFGIIFVLSRSCYFIFKS